MSPLWLSLKPQQTELQLSLSRPTSGPLLRARLPLSPAQPQALTLLLEALVAWFGLPLCAVLDADAEDVRRRPEFWARFHAEVDSPHISVEWTSVPLPNQRRFLSAVGKRPRTERSR
jgi:hypothetical protein